MTTDIGNYLREIRGKRSLRNISELTGISHTHLSDIEKGKDRRTGKTMIPSPDALKKIADGTGADYLEMLKIAGYLSNYMEEELIQLENKAKERYKEGAKHANDFDLSIIDDAIEKLDDAVRFQKEVIRDKKKVDFKDAAFLNGLYKTIKEMDVDVFSEEDRQRLRGIISLLLSNARDIDIDDIHKQLKESKSKNNKE